MREGMTNLDLIIFVICCVEFFVSASSAVIIFKHLYNKISTGVVSIFMLALGVFMLAICLQSVASFIYSYLQISNPDPMLLVSIMGITWITSHIGSVISLLALGALVRKKRFDVYIVTGHNNKS